MSDFDKLNREQRQYVARAIALSQREIDHASVTLPDGSEAFAYPVGGGRTSWGINTPPDFFCAYRGTWPEDRE